MKNYGEVSFPKGFVGYESETGYNNWWYPDNNSPIIMPMNVMAQHLHLWRNQDPFMVFAVPMCVFNPPLLFDKQARKKYIAVWFHKEAINEIINSQDS